MPAFRRAAGFLLNQSLVPKVFTDLAQRYSERPGGYTRIHKFGNRPGDNAPHAILELVDNPRDLRFAMTARAVGWELLGKRVGQQGPKAVVASGIPEVEDVVAREKDVRPEERGKLRPITRRNIQKVLKYRGREGVDELSKMAEDHVVRPVSFVLRDHDVYILYRTLSWHNPLRSRKSSLPSRRRRERLLLLLRTSVSRRVKPCLVAYAVHFTLLKVPLARTMPIDGGGLAAKSLV